MTAESDGARSDRISAEIEQMVCEWLTSTLKTDPKDENAKALVLGAVGGIVRFCITHLKPEATLDDIVETIATIARGLVDQVRTGELN